MDKNGIIKQNEHKNGVAGLALKLANVKRESKGEKKKKISKKS